MDDVLKRYIAATLIVIVIVMAFELLYSSEWIDWLIVGICIGVIYPCLVSGLFMYLEGRGYNAVNGVDLSHMTESQKRNFASYMGIFMIIGMIIMMISIGMLLTYTIPAIAIMVVSIAIFFIPIVTKEKGAAKQFVEKSVGKKIAVFAICSLIAIVPTVVLENMENKSETVVVEFFDDYFTVKAPMVNKSFDYDKIVDLELDPDFDKGTRISGYHTPTIDSGTYKNGAFGSYTLASYAKVAPCAFFEYEGKYFAFNQSSIELTQSIYDELCQKVKG